MDSYDEKTARIKELASNPDALASHLTENTQGIQEAAPNIAQGISSTLSNGVAFLNSKIPHASDQFPMSHNFTPSTGQKNQFGRYFDAVDDPISLLDHVKKGTLTSEHMEAAQAVHPQLLDEMRKKVMEQMNPDEDMHMKYPVKVALSKFLGQPMDQSMTQPSIFSNQAALSQARQQAQAPVGGRKTQVAGFKNWKRPDRASTQTQKDVENE